MQSEKLRLRRLCALRETLRVLCVQSFNTEDTEGKHREHRGKFASKAGAHRAPLESTL